MAAYHAVHCVLGNVPSQIILQFIVYISLCYLCISIHCLIDCVYMIISGLTLIAVFRETMSVTDWYFLALLLGISEADFERIQQDEKMGKDRQKAIIRQWLQSGNASWAMLVSALRDEVVTQVAIAKNIADNHPSSEWA